MKMRTGILAGAALLLLGGSAQAALLGRAPLTPGGTDYQAYYEDVLNVTWVADANLAASNTFSVSGIGSSGLVQGQMSWYTANDWVGAMNAANYLGASNWRLPIITDTGPPDCDFAFGGSDCGYHPLAMSGSTVLSEMAYMKQTYGLWSAAPLPAAGWLFASALGLMGWRRKARSV